MQYTVKDISRILKFPFARIYQLIREGSIPAVRVGSKYCINSVELIEWATQKGITIPSELYTHSAPEENELPTIGDALNRGGVYYNITGSTTEEVLSAVVSLFPLPQEVNRTFLLQSLLMRESLGSTSIGEGIAIPHVRNPIVLHIPQPIVLLCFLQTPIEFNAIDKKPVSILFNVISTTVRTHLHLLARLSYLLHNTPVKNVVLESAPMKTILNAIRNAEEEINSMVSSQEKKSKK